MPRAIDRIETSALTKFSEPASAFSPTISVMPTSPIARSAPPMSGSSGR
jgi:hypothetical protein